MNKRPPNRVISLTHRCIRLDRVPMRLYPLTTHRAFAADLTIFAAASLKGALDEASVSYMRQYGDKVKISFGPSSALARQIVSGAPANIFISADLDWMDYLENRNLIQKDTRKNLLGNRLVLAAPSDADIKLTIKSGFDWLARCTAGNSLWPIRAAFPQGNMGRLPWKSSGCGHPSRNWSHGPRMSGAHYFSFPGTKPRLGSSMRPMWRLIPV
jgi:Bacterial extracellular solute-binding protein